MKEATELATGSSRTSWQAVARTNRHCHFHCDYLAFERVNQYHR